MRQTSVLRTPAAAVFLLVGLGMWPHLTGAAGQGPTAGNAVAKACGLLPVPDIEALYKAKVSTAPRGTDGSALSICTVTIAGQAVKVSSSPPGTAGVPSSVQQGLAAMQGITSSSKDGPKPEAKDYGDVGCARITTTTGFDKKPLAKPIYSTSCFQVTGGYLILTIVSDDPTIATDEHVKALLANSAARRKAS